MFTADGWLNPGDTARFDETGHLYITARLKEIIVMLNGKKTPPVDMEAAILQDNLFEQALVLGEGRPYLTAFVVVNRDQWTKLAGQNAMAPDVERIIGSESAQKIVLDRVQRLIKSFPGNAQNHCEAAVAETLIVEYRTHTAIQIL